MKMPPLPGMSWLPTIAPSSTNQRPPDLCWLAELWPVLALACQPLSVFPSKIEVKPSGEADQAGKPGAQATAISNGRIVQGGVFIILSFYRNHPIPVNTRPHFGSLDHRLEPSVRVANVEPAFNRYTTGIQPKYNRTTTERHATSSNLSRLQFARPRLSAPDGQLDDQPAH